MKRIVGLLWVGAAGLALSLNSAARANDHPFTLVNVVDLFELFSISGFDNEFDPISQTPSNWAEYSAAPRLGTNPSVVAVAGNRAWVGGFYNGANFNRFGPVDANRAAWYAATGVAEVRDIWTQSGFGGNHVRYPGTLQVGPGILNTDWMTGIDYDAAHKILYVAYDANNPPNPAILPNAGLPWQFYESYIAAIDADEDSPTYGQALWKRQNPLAGVYLGTSVEQRLLGGLAVDNLDPTWIVHPVQGFGTLALFNTLDPNAGPQLVFVTDGEQLQCGSTAFRGTQFHPVTGEFYARVLNGIQYVPRDTRQQVAPFRPYARFIREPSAGGNGSADTLAQGDDEQLVPLGALVGPSENIIGVGPNGVLDTLPAGDDVLSTSALVTSRIVGNPDGNCPNDPDGFPAGNNPQGQGLAVITADVLAALDEDWLLANNRAVFGANQATDLRFFTTAGDETARLLLPCSPLPAVSPASGVAIYNMDYDPETGTLVVLEFERRLLFVYRAQLVGGPMIPRFDFTRNGALNLRDLAGFQLCFTGSEAGGTLSLTCMRMNSNEDCDVDFEDFLALVEVWDTLGDVP